VFTVNPLFGQRKTSPQVLQTRSYHESNSPPNSGTKLLLVKVRIFHFAEDSGFEKQTASQGCERHCYKPGGTEALKGQGFAVRGKTGYCVVFKGYGL
jgi:hypothetical protein